MKTNPIFQFNSTTETGIDKVPENAMVLIKDSDGAGTPMQVIKTALGSLDSTSTVQDFLNDVSLYAGIEATLSEVNGGTY